MYKNGIDMCIFYYVECVLSKQISTALRWWYIKKLWFSLYFTFCNM